MRKLIPAFAMGAAALLIAAFLLAPWLLEHRLRSQVQASGGHDLQFAELELDLLALRFSLLRPAVRDREGDALFDAERVTGRLDAAALLRTGIGLRELVLEQPRFTVWLGDAGGRSTAADAFPPWHIAELEVIDGALRLDAGGADLQLRDVRLRSSAFEWQGRRVRAGLLMLQQGTGRLELRASAPAEQPHAGAPARGRARTSAPGWVLQIEELATEALDLAIVDRGAAMPVELVPRDIELRLLGLDTEARAPARLRIAASLNGSEPLRAEGWIDPFRPAAELAIAFADVDLIALQPYVARMSGLRLQSARLSSQALLSYEAGSLQAAGPFELRSVSLLEAAGGRPVAAAERIELAGLGIDFAAGRAWLEQADLQRAFLRLELGDDEPSALERLESALGSLTLERVRIDDSSAELVDRGLSPAFRLELDRLKGTIERRSSPDSGVVARLRLDGRLDRSASAVLAGELGLAGASRKLSLALNARGVGAELLSPYAARFTGRNLEAGTLDMSLSCRIEHGRLTGESSLVADHLELGPPVTAPAASDLPLELALALLEDPRRRIALEFPFEGRLDDETFRAALGRGLAERLAGIARSPFLTLGSLVSGGGAPAGIVFAPGSAEISEPGLEALERLSAALAQRPALAIHAVGRYAPVADREALARRQVRLHVALATSDRAALARDELQISFDDPRVQSVLEEFAGERLDATTLAELAARFHDAEQEAAEGERRAAYFAAVFEALSAQEQVSAGALQRLARFRARAVADRLIALGVAAERVSVAEQIERLAAQEVQVALYLDARAMQRVEQPH